MPRGTSSKEEAILVGKYAHRLLRCKMFLFWSNIVKLGGKAM